MNISKCKKIHINKSGFSIVEFVIVMAILTILALIAIVGLSSQTNLKRLEVAILEFSHNLRTIQNYSMVGYKDDTGNVAAGFGIYIQDASTYILFRDENGNGVRDTGVDVDFKTVVMPTNVNITTTGGVISTEVPKGYFCYDEDNEEGSLDCTADTIITLKINNTTLSKRVFINHVSGKVDYDK